MTGACTYLKHECRFSLDNLTTDVGEKALNGERLPGTWRRLKVGGDIHWVSKTSSPLAPYTQARKPGGNLMACCYQENRPRALTAHLKKSRMHSE